MRKANNSMNQYRMRKAIVLVAFLGILALTLFPGKVMSQVFLTQEDMENSLRAQAPEEFVIPVPYEGGDADQYLPLGDGLLLLVGLGSCYLLKKRRKEGQQ